MDARNFQNSLARAQQMMLDENFNRAVERQARMHSANSGRNNSDDLADLEAQAFGYSPQPQTYQQIPIVNTKRNINESQLPKEIIESFKQMPAMSGDDGGMVPDSLFQGLYEQQQPQVMPSQRMTTMGGNGSSVDYGLIKTIVESCMAEYHKNMLNENTIRGMKIGKGNKIQFIDAKGNLYEGVLTLKKRANQ